MLNFYFWEPIIIFTALNVAMTLGLYITAMSGQISMATAAIAGAAAYFSAVLTVKFGVSFEVALLGGAMLGGLIGIVLSAAIARMRDFILKLTTLAFGEALAVLAFNWDYIGGANSFTGISAETGLWTSLAVAVLAALVAWRFDGSRFGFMSRAVRSDPVAASSTGVSILQVRMITFALGAALVGLAGAAQAHYVLVINPHDLGFFASLNFVIFLLFGGMYTVGGAILGAVVLTVAPEVLRFSNEYRLILYGFIIVVIVMVRPDGLLMRRSTGHRSRIFGTRPRGNRAPVPFSSAQSESLVDGVLRGRS
jgi:branched-chain amino acid transport system permease protein